MSIVCITIRSYTSNSIFDTVKFSVTLHEFPANRNLPNREVRNSVRTFAIAITQSDGRLSAFWGGGGGGGVGLKLDIMIQNAPGVARTLDNYFSVYTPVEDTSRLVSVGLDPESSPSDLFIHQICRVYGDARTFLRESSILQCIECLT